RRIASIYSPSVMTPSFTTTSTRSMVCAAAGVAMPAASIAAAATAARRCTIFPTMNRVRKIIQLGRRYRGVANPAGQVAATVRRRGRPRAELRPRGAGRRSTGSVVGRESAEVLQFEGEEDRGLVLLHAVAATLRADPRRPAAGIVGDAGGAREVLAFLDVVLGFQAQLPAASQRPRQVEIQLLGEVLEVPV